MSTVEPRRILKADAARELGARVAFNYDDFRARCDEHLGSVRAEAQRIIEEARQEGERIRARAAAEGKTAGRAEGLRDAEAAVEHRAAELASRRAEERLAGVLPALENAARELLRERDRWLEAWETMAVRLAVAVAEKLVRCELELHPERAFDAAAAALELAAGSPQVEIRMHPEDVRLAEEHGEQVLRSVAAGGGRLVPDESISRGGCVVETRHGTIDARLETQIERIVAELMEGA